MDKSKNQDNIYLIQRYVQSCFPTEFFIIDLLNKNNFDFSILTALSMYLGEGCRYCDKIFNTIEDLNGAVFAGQHDKGRLACGGCGNIRLRDQNAAENIRNFAVYPQNIIGMT